MSVDNVKDTTHRFGDVAGEPCTLLAPIEGFNEKPLVTLEEAVQPLIDIVSGIVARVYIVKSRAVNPPNNLTVDESAAIALYTMEWEPCSKSLYYILNSKLRTEDRKHLKPWFLYLKLLFTALSRLPSSNPTVYRGVQYDNVSEYEKYREGADFVWWGFSSCSTEREICEKEQFLGESGQRILFVITCLKGTDIKMHSYFKQEREILLLPTTRFKVVKHEKNEADDLLLVYLEEIQLPHPLLESVSSPEEIEKLKKALPSLPKLVQTKSTTSEFERSYNPRVSQYVAGQTPRSQVVLNGRRYNEDEISDIVEQLIVKKQCSEFFLRDNQMTYRGVMNIARALNHPDNRVQQLFLSDNKIGDRGAKVLAEALSNNQNIFLRQLCLGHNEISDEGVEHIAVMLKSNQTLSHLWLQHNKIEDQGLQRLAAVLTSDNKTLQLLSLERNKCGRHIDVNCILSVLKENKSLLSLNLNSCKLSRLAVRQIRSAVAAKPKFQLILH